MEKWVQFPIWVLMGLVYFSLLAEWYLPIGVFP